MVRECMNRFSYILVGLFGIVLLSSFMTPKVKKDNVDEVQRVYLYGVSTDFNDSVVYMTDIHSLDSVVVNKEGALQNYSSYSFQMKVFMSDVLGQANQTCAVIYSVDKKKLEKRYLKMRKKYQSDKDCFLKQLGTDAFMFRKE